MLLFLMLLLVSLLFWSRLALATAEIIDGFTGITTGNSIRFTILSLFETIQKDYSMIMIKTCHLS